MTDDTTIPGTDIRPLDLTPILDARAEALELAERLRLGDRSAIIPARAMLDAADARGSIGEAALRAAGVTTVRTLDALGEIVSALGFGDLQLWLDVIEGREDHPSDDSEPAITIGDEVQVLDTPATVTSFLPGGRVGVALRGGEEIVVAASQLAAVAQPCGR